MLLENISIINYKNIKESNLQLSPKVNCLIGLNGEGKTNFLDAIYYLSFCRSAFTSIDSQVICHDKEFFVLEGTYLNEHDEKEHIYCGMKRGTKKHFKRNKKEYSRLSEHIGLIPLVMISPSDAILIEGGSEERRKLMDVVISQYNHSYMDALNRYNKALMQRNALLREEVEPDKALLEIWEQQMASEGEQVYTMREQFVQNLIPIFQDIYQFISGGNETVSLEYVSHCQRGSLLEVIQRDRFKDRAVGYSLHGIHRDDLMMMLDGYPIKKVGSQGQNKTFVIALKLAQFSFLKHIGMGTTPLLLLDDIFDKLDVRRVERIVDLVAGKEYGQIFITDTNREHLDKIIHQYDFDCRIFNVRGGEITVRNEYDESET